MPEYNALTHGVDTTTGEYLTPEQRKALFKKGRMKSAINTKSFRYGTENVKRGKGSAIVKVAPQNTFSSIVPIEKEEQKQEAQFETDEVKTVFDQTKSIFNEILKTKKEKERLRDKYFKLLGKKKTTPVPEEGDVESPKKKRRGFGLKAPKMNVFGMLGDLLKFAVLDWISKPENRPIVNTFVKIFQAVAKFFNWFVTGVVDNILSGFGELVGGDSLLERIGGFFKLTFGVIGLRWLLNPLKLFKDLGRARKIFTRFIKTFSKIFKQGAKGMTKTFTNVLSLAGKAFKKTLGKLIKRFFLKVFGKAITKGVKSIAKFALKSGLKLVRRFPLIGPVIAFGIELAMGEPVGRAAFKAIGATLLAGLGGIIGSIVPFAGTAIGAIVGGLAGEWAGGAMYDLFFKGKEEKTEGGDTPEMSDGGIASGPKEGYLAMLHGTEAVIPISKLGDALALPFKTLGSAIIGAMMSSINSIGSAANFVRPIIISVLGPMIKEFGIEKYTINDKVGKTQGSSDSLARHISSETEKRDLDKFFDKDILKDLGLSLMTAGGSLLGSFFGTPAHSKSTNPTGSGAPDIGASGGDYPPDAGTTSSVGDMPGSGISKGVKIAKMLQKDLGISAAAAAGIVGNLMLESGLQSDNVENGKGFDDGPISNIPPGTRRVGYGWGQWTNDRLENFRKFLRARGKENVPATDQDNYDYLLHELRTTEPIRGHWKGWQGPNIPEDDPSKAATWFMMNWERPGVPHQDKRQKFAQSIFKSLGSNIEQTAQTQAPQATPLSPEQKANIFEKSGMVSLADSVRKSSPKKQVPQAQIKKTQSSNSMTSLSKEFSIQQVMRQNVSQSSPISIFNVNTANTNLTMTTPPLNSTSIGESILLNRI